MDLILVRHAIAEERDYGRWPDDSLRPLTTDGIERFERGARGIATLVDPPERLFTSPYVRTRQTAEILTAEADWPEAEPLDALGATASTAAVLGALAGLDCRSAGLVGHEPNLSLLAHALLPADEADDLDGFKKGAAILIAFDGRPAPDGGRLVWAHAPRALRDLA
jgi:phosphohistidine phosphatase